MQVFAKDALTVVNPPSGSTVWHLFGCHEFDPANPELKQADVRALIGHNELAICGLFSLLKPGTYDLTLRQITELFGSTRLPDLRGFTSLTIDVMKVNEWI
jgi:hypothetical protein